MRALLIVNPNATSTTPATRDLLAHALESRVQLTVAHTQHRGHAAELAQWAAAQQMDLIVVHGGDGTVNEAINGYLPHPMETPPETRDAERLPKLAVLPGGSANVFARSLGIDPDPVVAAIQLIDLLSRDAHRRIGLARADDRWFTFNAGLGLDAAVCERIERSRAEGRSATPGRYLRTTVFEFLRNQRSEPTLTLEFPGQRGDLFHYAFVSNSSPWTYLNKRPVRTNPGTSFETGLGVFAMRSMRVLPTLRMARQLLSDNGNPGSPLLTRVDDLPDIRIRSSVPIGLQMDGDFIGRRTVVDFTSAPGVLDVVAPKLG